MSKEDGERVLPRNGQNVDVDDDDFSIVHRMSCELENFAEKLGTCDLEDLVTQHSGRGGGEGGGNDDASHVSAARRSSLSWLENDEEFEGGRLDDDNNHSGDAGDFSGVVAILHERLSFIEREASRPISLEELGGDDDDDDDGMEMEEEGLLAKSQTLYRTITESVNHESEKYAKTSRAIADHPGFDTAEAPPPSSATSRLGRRLSVRSLTDVVRPDYHHLPDFKEVASHEALYPELLGRIYSGLIVEQDYGDLYCAFMLECCVRADKAATEIIEVIANVGARSGLDLRRLRGGQVILWVREFVGWEPWAMVDAQVVTGRATRHRLVLVRFMSKQGRNTSSLESTLSMGVGCELCEGPRKFVEDVKNALRTKNMLNSDLVTRSPLEGEFPSIDDHYLSQLSTICIDDALMTLHEVGGTLRLHSAEEERKYESCISLLRPMFDQYRISPVPPPVPSQRLSLAEECAVMEYEMEKTLPQLEGEDVNELNRISFQTAADQMLGVVNARVLRKQAQCDEDVSQRVGRLNMQVLRRLGGTRLYLREMLQNLRMEQEAVLRSSVGQKYLKRMNQYPLEDLNGVDPEMEVPLYHCAGVCGSFTAHLYITYGSAIVVSTFPGVKRIHALRWVDVSEICFKKGVLNNSVEICMRPPIKALSFTPAMSSALTLSHLMSTMTKIKQEPADALQMPLR